VPRTINNICDNALLICMTKGLKEVNHKILTEVWEAVQTDTLFAPRTEAPKGDLPWLSVSACLASLVLGFVLGQHTLVGQYVKGRSVADLCPTIAQSFSGARLTASRPLQTLGGGAEKPGLATTKLASVPEPVT
jgi:hypothetical protein